MRELTLFDAAPRLGQRWGLQGRNARRSTIGAHPATSKQRMGGRRGIARSLFWSGDCHTDVVDKPTGIAIDIVCNEAELDPDRFAKRLGRKLPGHCAPGARGGIRVDERANQRIGVLGVALLAPTAPVNHGDVGVGRREPYRGPGRAVGVAPENVAIVEAPSVIIVAPTREVLVGV